MLLIVGVLFTILFQFSTTNECNSTTNECANGYHCMRRQATVDGLPDSFQEDVEMADEYSCEPRKFCELLGSHNQCQKASIKRTFTIYFSTINTKLNNVTLNQNELCNYKPFNFSLTVNISLDCCSTSNCLAQFSRYSATDCPTLNAKLSDSIYKLFQCYIPDNIWIYVQCNKTNSCTQILRDHIDSYQWCACKSLFDFLGVEGYDYLTILASWTQIYSRDIMSFVGIDEALSSCDVEEMELDCYPLIEECLVQIGTDWNYNPQCIENVYEGSVVELPTTTTIDNKHKYDSKAKRNGISAAMIIIIVSVAVVSICICVVIAIFCRIYIASNGRKQMPDLQHMKQLPSSSMSPGSFNEANHTNGTETAGEIEGFGMITKMESAVRLGMIDNNGVNNMSGEKKQNEDSDDDIYNEGKGKVVMTPKGNEMTPKGFEENEYVTDNGYGNDERKQENVLLDSMLSDVLQMQDLDPNKIHQKNMENVKNNDTDSDDSDNMYEKSESDEKSNLQRDNNKQQMKGLEIGVNMKSVDVYK